MRRIQRLVLAICLLNVGRLSAQRSEIAPTWTLVEDLRIGSDQGPTSFSDVRGLLATRSGNIFVLDYKTQEIRVFDATGKFLKLAARRGAGPGEIRNANGVAIGKGDTVWTSDPSNGRFSLYQPNGDFIKQIVLPIQSYGYIWQAAIDDKGRAIDLPVYVPGSKVDPETGRPMREERVRFVTTDAKADTAMYPTCPIGPPSTTPPFLYFQRTDGRGNMMRGIPYQPRQQIVLTRAGTVWCTASGEYRVSVGPVGGTLKEVIHVTVPPVVVTPEERKKELDAIDSIARSYGPLTKGEPSSIPRTKPVIANIHTDDQSRVWVRLTDTPEAKPAYDVYDATGRLVARAKSNGKVGSQVFIGGDYLYTVTTDDDDVPLIVRYRIVR